MNTVKIYRIWVYQAWEMAACGVGYSLEPWENNIDYKGEDDGGTDYILPDGFKVAEDTMGSLQVYDQDNCYCEIINYNDRPALVLDYGLKILKRA